MGTTAKHAIPYLEGGQAIADIDEADRAQAEHLDDIIAIDAQGSIALRPTSTPSTPGKPGRYYFATDTGSLYRDHGMGWTEVTTAPVFFNELATSVAQALVPTGVVLPTAGSTAPDGYLLCDGSAVSRSTYAALFAAIGTAYGAGDGSTTFDLPDLRGRVPVGKGTHADVDTLGESDGLAVGSRTPSHVHTGPPHSHSTPNHQHQVQSAASLSEDLVGPVATGSGATFLAGRHHTHVTTNSGGGNTGTAGNGNTGAASAPFVVLNYIVKT